MDSACDDATQEAIASEIERRLGDLDVVADAEAVPDQPMIGVETVLVVTAVVSLIRSGREGTEESTKLVRALKELIREVRGVRSAYLSSGDERVPLDAAEARLRG